MTDEENEKAKASATPSTEQRVFDIFQGGKQSASVEDDTAIPELDYEIVDTDNNQFSIRGFVVFTPQHLAIMRDYKTKGPIPVLVLPMSRVGFVGLKADLNLPESED